MISNFIMVKVGSRRSWVETGNIILMYMFTQSGIFNLFEYEGLLHCFSASVLQTPNTAQCTEQNVCQAIAHCLKYAPDRRGGGGRN